MRIRLIVVLMILSMPSVYAQKNVLTIINGDFELGTVQFWRALEVSGIPRTMNYIGKTRSYSSLEISEDSYNGDYAAAFTWGTGTTLGDILFDLSPMILAETNYTFKAWVKSLDGPCILRLHCVYYSANNAIIGEHVDQSWILSDVYEEYIWEVPAAPEGVLFGTIGFRLFNADGSRWPADDITTLIDDVTLWRDSNDSDIAEYKLSTASAGSGTGTIKLNPAGGIYCEGTQVTATIIPNEGSTFASWSGDAFGSEETTTILMDGDKTIVAETDIVNSIENVINQSSNLKCFPNPFNSSTTLSYTLSENSNVKLSIYNITGGLVNLLINQKQNRGEHKVIWKGTNLIGNNLPNGVYFGRLSLSGGKYQVIKILLSN